jgi:hypothetical protein
LCEKHSAPVGTKQLLGLNLNYCLAFKNLPSNINKTIQKMAYSIRTKHYLNSNHTSTDAEYIKQLYRKNITWNPPPAPNLTEEKITQFEKAIKNTQQKLINKNIRTYSSNLTTLQSRALQALGKTKTLLLNPQTKT